MMKNAFFQIYRCLIVIFDLIIAQFLKLTLTIVQSHLNVVSNFNLFNFDN